MPNYTENIMLSGLKDYLRNTSRKEIVSEWNRIESLGFSGPNAFEYLQYLNQVHFPHLREFCTSTEINYPKNMTPNFSGSVFLCNIVL